MRNSQQVVRRSPNHQSPNPYTYGVPHAYYQQQQMYDQQFVQQQNAQSDFESDSTDDEHQVVTLQNGQRITMAEYKRIYQVPRQNPNARGGGRQTLMSRKEAAVKPVQRIAPLLLSQESGESSNSSISSVVPTPAPVGAEGAAETQSAKMLIFLQNGEQRLIKFTLPKEICTLQEVLEQVNVPFSDDTHIQCMQNANSDIDYFVSIGSSMRIEEMIQNHPMLQKEVHAGNVMAQQNSDMSTPEKMQCSGSESPASSPRPCSPPPRFVEGMLALCKFCGYTGCDFSKCQRCKRKFTEEPKGVPIPKKAEQQKKKEPEKINILKPTPEIKLNLLKVTKTVASPNESAFGASCVKEPSYTDMEAVENKIGPYEFSAVGRTKPVECSVCCELSEENVIFEPCGHRVACEHCVGRMKKCLQCKTIIEKRVTIDGRVLACRSRQPSAERLRYLECKIQEMEETHGCSICMERRRSVAFLCGHQACTKCAATLTTCHMCRQPITTKINLY